MKNKIEDIDFDNIDLSDFQEDVDEIRNDIKNIKNNKKLMSVLKKKEIERILATSGKYITYAERCYVLDYITNLQEKVDQYENPDDMTLMFMWCDEKAKDKIKQLQEERNTLYKYTPEKGFRLVGDEEWIWRK